MSDLDHFESWCGGIPASAETVATYLAAHADALSVATLVRRIASISKAHDARSLPNPCRSELVKATLRGVKRTNGTAQREARPLLKEDLFAVLDAMGGTVKDARDRALLLVGFGGGFRRSELVGIDLSSIEFVRQGMIITLRRSKTDQLGAGRKVGVPFGRTRHCAVGALEAWIARAGLSEGAVFRCVDRHGRISDQRLSGEAVALVIKQRIAAAGMDAGGYSGHSLRAGLVTSAAQQPPPQQPPQSRAGRTRSPQAGSVAGIGPNAAVSVAKAPGDGITGAGPAIITTGSGVGNRLTAKKAAPNRAAFLYSCAGADQIRTRDQP